MGRFDDCLAFVLEREAGYTNNPADRGGATNKGITQTTYDTWCRGHGRQPQDVRNITDDEVAAIYRAGYWDAAHCAIMPRPLDLVVFDCAVNQGTGRAIRFLQRALGVADDGIFGAGTMAAINEEIAAGQIGYVAWRVVEERRNAYDALAQRDPSQQKFLNGWHNRLVALGQVAGLSASC